VLESVHASYDTYDPEFIGGLYDVLNIFLVHTEILSQWLLSGMALLVTHIPDVPTFVTSKHLKLLTDICNPETVPFIIDQAKFYEDAISVENIPITSDFIWTMKLLTKLVQLGELNGETLVSAAFNLLLSSHEHTIALDAAAEVLVAMARIKEWRDEILDRFVMIAQHTFWIARSRSRIMVMFCYKIMLQLETCIDWDGYDRFDFDEVYRTHVSPLSARIELEYGGPVVEVSDYRDYI
jgi:hypothetical protein